MSDESAGAGAADAGYGGVGRYWELRVNLGQGGEQAPGGAWDDCLDFYALSRFDDVEACEKDWRTSSRVKGSVLEVIKVGVDLPPGTILLAMPERFDGKMNGVGEDPMAPSRSTTIMA